MWHSRAQASINIYSRLQNPINISTDFVFHFY
ncbi:hypothetical protein Pint_18494 [Pistacia integerrima]|uniref:Uncharacterized protein n=1 Tax=Pistacia integerrima TaxID=434235 RepID=A0ACC0YWR1_9ROSI|nr:hypothetical protein Pint_18494 [Pistacia integerrima]